MIDLPRAPQILRTRHAPTAAIHALVNAGVHPLLAQVYAGRGITDAEQLDTALTRLLPPTGLRHVERMASLLADAITEHKRLLIIADYDADGATACAVGLRALRAMCRNTGTTVDYLVPNRFEYGYGLTPEIVQLAARVKQPDILITVDNGIASVEGVAEANRLGLQVLVTDHHLPGDTLPDAWCIVNPNQPECTFASKHLAGVGVMFYVMLALRAELRKRGTFVEAGAEPHHASRLTPHASPNLAELLDLVALGTVADVVRLDENNRVLVDQGLKRIRAGRAHAGIKALLNVAGRDATRASTYDMGFVLGPRLNAAGRLTDMSLGIECLVTDDAARASAIARELDQLNRERRAIEADMRDSALAAIDDSNLAGGYSVSLFDAAWHQGVTGIVASRIKDRLHRPAIAFARGAHGEIKGSGRSIRGLHLRDALDLVSKREPGLILRFGGHAAAAGLSLRETDFERFRAAFESVSRDLLSLADLQQEIEIDGSLPKEHASLDAARAVSDAVWGQGFAEPRFADVFEVAQQRVVGGHHLKLRLKREGALYDAMLFGQADPLPTPIHAVYRFGVNEFNGTVSVQLTLEHWVAA